MESLTELLLYAASIAVIVIAVAVVVVAYAVYNLLKRVESLVRSVRGELEVLTEKRKKVEVNGRTALRLAKMAALFMVRRRLF